MKWLWKYDFIKYSIVLLFKSAHNYDCGGEIFWDVLNFFTHSIWTPYIFKFLIWLIFNRRAGLKPKPANNPTEGDDATSLNSGRQHTQDR